MKQLMCLLSIIILFLSCAVQPNEQVIKEGETSSPIYEKEEESNKKYYEKIIESNTFRYYSHSSTVDSNNKVHIATLHKRIITYYTYMNKKVDKIKTIHVNTAFAGIVTDASNDPYIVYVSGIRNMNIVYKKKGQWNQKFITCDKKSMLVPNSLSISVVNDTVYIAYLQIRSNIKTLKLLTVNLTNNVITDLLLVKEGKDTTLVNIGHSLYMQGKTPYIAFYNKETYQLVYGCVKNKIFKLITLAKLHHINDASLLVSPFMTSKSIYFFNGSDYFNRLDRYTIGSGRRHIYGEGHSVERKGLSMYEDYYVTSENGLVLFSLTETSKKEEQIHHNKNIDNLKLWRTYGKAVILYRDKTDNKLKIIEMK